MSHPPRWIVVDDTSSDIGYTGNSWFDFNGNPISNQVWGLPYQNTLHGTDSNASLVHVFTGSAVRVRGTVHTQNISGVIDPTWKCFVDGIEIDNVNGIATNGGLNNWNYCEGSGLNDGVHTLIVTTTVAKQQTFWLDRIEYLPSAGVPLENKTLLLSSYLDPAFKYSFGWDGAATDIAGSSVSFDFVGTSLSWYTEYKQNYSTSQTTATWSIDDRAIQNVTLPAHERGSSLLHQKLFDTGTLEMGTHRLKVTYNGISNANTPLNLAYLYIQNGTFQSANASSSPGANSKSGSVNLGAIIGSTVSVVVLLLIVLVVYRFRRNSRRHEKHESFKKATPYVEIPNLHYTYQAGEGRPTGPGANRVTNPEDSTNRQVTPARPAEEHSGAIAHQDDAIQPDNVHLPEGSVIDLPPAYSLN